MIGLKYSGKRTKHIGKLAYALEISSGHQDDVVFEMVEVDLALLSDLNMLKMLNEYVLKLNILKLLRFCLRLLKIDTGNYLHVIETVDFKKARQY